MASDTGDDSQGRTHEWNVRAARYAPLIDGEEYFRALRSSIIAARHQILIVGWEIHSEVALLRGEAADEAAERDGYPVVLTDLLQRIVEERDELRVFMLIWSGAALFAIEREHFPRMKRPWEQHPRIRFEWAEDTPTIASHHQKLVVVDDRVAFAGGIDLTKSRWDAHAHRVEDHRRRKPGLIPDYANPYHDTMAVLSGEVAETLGGLARSRWDQATSERLDPPGNTDQADGDAPWPDGVEPLFEDREIFVALTQPDYGGRDEKRQVEAAFVRHIRRAQDLIYIETQYLTASHIVDELVARLEDPDGPEVVVVLPYGCPGVLQSMALDHERDRLLERLRDADPGGRFGVYWPTLAGGDDDNPFETSVYVHAKVTVVDDRLLRIGSANLNNRSMGLDTELDTWIEGEEGDEDDDATRRAIASFRRRSLSYLLACEAEAIERAEEEHGSLVAAIESLRDGDSTLFPLTHKAPEYSKAAPLNIRIADPIRPLEEADADKVLKAMADDAGLHRGIRRVKAAAIGSVRRHAPWWVVVAVLVLAGVAVLFTPLRGWLASIDAEALLRSLRDSGSGIAGVFVVFVILGSLGMPITALIVAAGAVIDSWWSAPFALVGVLLAAVPGFVFGRLAPDGLAERLDQGKLGKVTGAFRDHAILGVAAVRNLPIAPFAVMNAALGVSRLPFRSYLVGTGIGMLPGVVMLSLFGSGVVELITDPDPASVGVFAGIVVALIGVTIGMKRLLKRFAPGTDSEPES